MNPDVFKVILEMMRKAFFNQYPDNEMALLGNTMRGSDYKVKYQEGFLICEPSGTQFFIVILAGLLLGPVFGYGVAWGPGNQFATFPILIRIGCVVMQLFGWWGIYHAFFSLPKIVFDCSQKKIRFCKGRRSFYMLESDQIDSFAIKDVSRFNVVRGDIHTMQTWTGYVVCVKRADGRELPLAETSNKACAENFLNQINEWFLHQAVDHIEN